MAADDNEAMHQSDITPSSSPSASGHAAPGDAPAGVAGLTRLDDWGVIRATGADARRFLHGQLTQDIEHLPLDQARLAGFCSAKGRLQASFVVWRDGDDDVLLACSADLLAATLKRLSMFVLRAKCSLADVSAEWPLWGLAGPAPQTAGEVWSRRSADGQILLRLPDALIDGARVERRLVAGDPPADAPTASPGSWGWLEVHSGVPRIVAATAEQFVPQMVNLELVGGVDFQKGCYPGQEIVARSQYRGTLKRRAQIVTGRQALRPGTEIFHGDEAEQPAGMVVLGASFEGRHAALAELKLTALVDGSLWASAHANAGIPAVTLGPDAPAPDRVDLQLSTLPYPIPTDAG